MKTFHSTRSWIVTFAQSCAVSRVEILSRMSRRKDPLSFYFLLDTVYKFSVGFLVVTLLIAFIDLFPFYKITNYFFANVKKNLGHTTWLLFCWLFLRGFLSFFTFKNPFKLARFILTCVFTRVKTQYNFYIHTKISVKSSVQTFVTYKFHQSSTNLSFNQD